MKDCPTHRFRGSWVLSRRPRVLFSNSPDTRGWTWRQNADIVFLISFWAFRLVNKTNIHTKVCSHPHFVTYSRKLQPQVIYCFVACVSYSMRYAQRHIIITFIQGRAAMQCLNLMVYLDLVNPFSPCKLLKSPFDICLMDPLYGRGTGHVALIHYAVGRCTD